MATALALTLCAGCKEKNGNDARVDELMSKMTLAEKIGQLNQFVPTNSVVTGPDGSPVDVNRVIKEGQCGSLLNVWKPEEIIELQRLAVDSSRLGIPILFGHDIIHGARTGFPENLGISCSWDPKAAETVARISAAEASAFGIAWTFSPMCDVSANLAGDVSQKVPERIRIFQARCLPPWSAVIRVTTFLPAIPYFLA